MDLLRLFEFYKDIVILKARQLGITWLLMGYALHKVLFNESAKVLMMSQEESSAWDLVNKTKFIHEHLPDSLRIDIKHDNKSELDFEANHSVISALPSTARAGKGTDATLVIRDEVAEHEEGKKNFGSIAPCIDGGGQQIDLSTIIKGEPENHFTERVLKLYQNGKREDRPSGLVTFTAGRSILIFLGWNLRPVREEGLTLEKWWDLNVKSKYEEWEIEQNYPKTIEEALSAPKTTCRFESSALKAMFEEAQKESPLKEDYNGLVKIYREPVAGRKYAFSVDPSEGSEDPSLGIIVDVDTHEECAKFGGKIHLDEQALIAFNLYKKYNEPHTAVERNACGLTLIEKMKALGVTKWHYADKEKKKEGWYTSGGSHAGGTRPYMIQDLAEAIRLRQLRINDPQEVSEFMTFIKRPNKLEGEAMKGSHDEAVMAWAIYWQIRKAIPRGNFGVSSFQYRD